jgi:hypothetical protein
MPAIQPARLRQQAVLLAERCADPEAYVRNLHFLMDFYADRARRPGQSGKPGPLITAYKVRPPVLRMILQETLPEALKDAQMGLALCDALWAEPYLEFRMLAAMLLGQLPTQPVEAITRRLEDWLAPNLEEHLVSALLTEAAFNLRQDTPQTLVNLIQKWMGSTDTFYQQVGLRALLTLIEDPNFENLPAFFHLLQPLARGAPSALRADLLDVLAALAKRSPQETAYFLRQTLGTPNAKDTAWLIRQILPVFPLELRQSLRETVRGL